MTIGRFAQLSGLSIHALRHYDDVGLLEPAVVDADTGYRRYQRGQIQRARLIGSLRWIDLPSTRSAGCSATGPRPRRSWTGTASG